MNKFIYTICLALALVSCDDWLDVNPKTNVEEADLFDTEQGFKEALTGVYIKTSEQNLYGRELTYGFIDILAQRYANPQNQNANFDDPTVWYTFPSTRTEGYTKNFWALHYNLIANLNNLLANIESYGDNIKTEGYREMIEGEALGLRAFLYLDLAVRRPSCSSSCQRSLSSNRFFHPQSSAACQGEALSPGTSHPHPRHRKM